MADRVELTDLDVITRYSVAVRSATADRDELVAVLRADLAWLESEPEPTAAEPLAAADPARPPAATRKRSVARKRTTSKR